MDSVELELSVAVTCDPIVHTPEYLFKICFLFFF